MLDLHYRSFTRWHFCNHTVGSELTVRCQSSHCNLVRGSTCCCPGPIRAHCQLSESTRIVAVILSEASHAIAMVLSETTVSYQSPHRLSWCSYQLVLMVLPWSCQHPPSVVRVYTYSRRDLLRGFSWYCPNLLRPHRQLSESAHILVLILDRIHCRLSESRHVFHWLPF